ncbi:MAG: Gfo/Idh/MocA family oxidoreductase [Methylacidiphilales bacterium]|nr:Gfo/Idh/MocA family oxidoreductase [Candidatus Methylacidiphilales bacterium]
MRTVAIIGCGKFVEGKEGWAIGHAHAQGWLDAFPDILLHGVDISKENLEAFGQRFNLPSERLFASTNELYNALTPDYVSVCTWPKLHAPQTIEAAKNGVKGIVCEKPLALNCGEIHEMLDACRKASVKLAVGHQRRLEPVFQLAKKLLHTGVIGEKWVLEARVPDGWDILSWTTHWFDMANFFFEGAPLRVLAGMDHRGNRRYQQAIEESSVVFADYAGDRQALFVTGPANASGAQIAIRGTEGLLTLDQHVEVFNRNGYQLHKAEPLKSSGGSFTLLCRQLVGAVEEGKPMECAAEICAAGTEIAYAAYESARTQRTISLPLKTQFAPFEILQHRPRLALNAGKIILFADEHFGSGGREGIHDALTEITGREIETIDASRGITSTDLEGAAYLLLYHTHAEASTATQTALRDWVGANRPLILVHAALGAYPKWDEYARWAGRVWDWNESQHPYQESVLRASVDGGRIFGWEEAWLPRDEVFIKLGERSACLDLVSVQIPEGTFPAAWISRQHMNIGVWVPGHREDMWTIPVMREGLVRLLQNVTAK